MENFKTHFKMAHLKDSCCTTKMGSSCIGFEWLWELKFSIPMNFNGFHWRAQSLCSLANRRERERKRQRERVTENSTPYCTLLTPFIWRFIKPIFMTAHLKDSCRTAQMGSKCIGWLWELRFSIPMNIKVFHWRAQSLCLLANRRERERDLDTILDPCTFNYCFWIVAWSLSSDALPEHFEMHLNSFYWQLNSFDTKTTFRKKTSKYIILFIETAQHHEIWAPSVDDLWTMFDKKKLSKNLCFLKKLHTCLNISREQSIDAYPFKRTIPCEVAIIITADFWMSAEHRYQETFTIDKFSSSKAPVTLSP